MISRFLIFTVFALVVVGAETTYAQSEPFPGEASGSSRPRRGDSPKGFKEMLARQKAARDKKDHEEMLARGEQALKLANQLEASFADNGSLSADDKVRLASLEDVVQKIRKELGGEDDKGAEGVRYLAESDEPRPSNVEEAFKFLHETTAKLVDELRKTTRFSISAVAIQSSNSVLKLVKFLRLRR